MRNRGALLGSVMLIVLASMLVGAGTFAWFSGTAENPYNVFEAGTLEIHDEPDQAFLVVPGVTDNIKPGDSGSASVKIINDGSLPVGSIDIKMEVTEGAGIALAGWLKLTLHWDGADYGPITVTSLPYEYKGLAGFTFERTLTVDWEFVETNADQNDAQGQKVVLMFTFTAHQ